MRKKNEGNDLMCFENKKTTVKTHSRQNENCIAIPDSC